MYIQFSRAFWLPGLQIYLFSIHYQIFPTLQHYRTTVLDSPESWISPDCLESASNYHTYKLLNSSIEFQEHLLGICAYIWCQIIEKRRKLTLLAIGMSMAWCEVVNRPLIFTSVVEPSAVLSLITLFKKLQRFLNYRWFDKKKLSKIYQNMPLS